MSALPKWIGRKLGTGERVLRLTDGPLAGELVLECTDDDGTRLVYTAADWDSLDNASLQFDGDGDLVWSRPDGGPSTRIVAWQEVA